MPRPSAFMKLLRFVQLRKTLAVQADDGFQEGDFFFKFFDAAFRCKRFEKRLLAFDQEVELFHDAALDDDAGIRGGLLEHVVFGLVDHGGSLGQNTVLCIAYRFVNHGLDFFKIFFVEHGEASLYLMEPV